MAELLAAFLGFWVFFPSVVMFLLMFFWVAYEVPVGATATLIVAAVVLQFLGKIQIAQSIVEHPFWTMAFIAGYLVAGVIWSIRWRDFSLASARSFCYN